jgi:hypothetical protein
VELHHLVQVEAVAVQLAKHQQQVLLQVEMAAQEL